MATYGWVFLGGGLGACLRVLVAQTLNTARFPWGTLAVNLVGSLAIGLLMGAWAGKEEPEPLRLLLVAGLLGGFTTFSAFSLETVRMLQERNLAGALGYVAASVGVGLGACALGFLVTKR